MYQVNLLPERLSPERARSLAIGIGLLATTACLTAAWITGSETWRQYVQGVSTISALPIPKWWVSIFIPYGTDSVSAAVQGLSAGGVNMRRIQLICTGLWDDTRLFSEQGAQDGWFATPDPAGYRAFSGRYRTRYGQDPVRPATLAYDAVSLVAALVKTQGAARFAEETLTNQSGFAGIDGVFRFRPDGTNQRGLAVMKVTPSGGQVISPAPKAFGSGT